MEDLQAYQCTDTSMVDQVFKPLPPARVVFDICPHNGADIARRYGGITYRIVCQTQKFRYPASEQITRPMTSGYSQIFQQYALPQRFFLMIGIAPGFFQR
jgi:hypothetical protein